MKINLPTKHQDTLDEALRALEIYVNTSQQVNYSPGEAEFWDEDGSWKETLRAVQVLADSIKGENNILQLPEKTATLLEHPDVTIELLIASAIVTTAFSKYRQAEGTNLEVLFLKLAKSPASGESEQAIAKEVMARLLEDNN